jgi:GDP-D-mannose 3',5'-epimerase
MIRENAWDGDTGIKSDDLIVICGAGGFIGGNLVRYFGGKGFTRIRAVDMKPLSAWYLRAPGAENVCYDVSQEDHCRRVCEGATAIYNLAADMGGMGFIERYQSDPDVRALKESDAYPAMAERGYGWEKLFSEMLCQEYWHERGLKTFIARFHNVYGPFGTWDGGREKAPAAICRKVIEAIDSGSGKVAIWGDGQQTRSFMYIEDCLRGIEKIMGCPELIATPINLGSSELVSINELVSKVEKIAGVTLRREYDLTAPKGVAGRNSDNTFIQQMLGWEPSTPLDEGLAVTYSWIKEQYERRKRGAKVVE